MTGIESRAHRPVSTPFRIPTQRKLDQCSPICAMQVGPRVIARTHHVVDLHVFDVGVGSVEAGLPAPLVVGSVTNRHRIVGAGKGMVVLIFFLVVFDGVGRHGPEQGSTHAGAAIAFVDGTMAGRAGRRDSHIRLPARLEAARAVAKMKRVSENSALRMNPILTRLFPELPNIQHPLAF